jgi:hypothetical protein
MGGLPGIGMTFQKVQNFNVVTDENIITPGN